MKPPMQHSLAALPLVAALLLAPCAASAQTPATLGELARKEEARRKALKTPPTKVLTNGDVPKGSAPPPRPATEAAQGVEAKSEGKPAEKPQEPVKDEAWWRQRMSQAREELRRNEMFADALQTRVNSLTNDFASRDDPYQRARVAEDRAKAVLELERVKADVDAGRKKIAEIEEDGRKAGIPPGWLR